jgi:Na+-translocating ferredoxin:NAD+ oxidoreductase subunit G
LLLAGTNEFLGPKIIEQQKKKFNDLAGAMVQGATSFESVDAEGLDITSVKGKPAKVDVKKGINADGDTMGWAFIAEGAGFADKIQIVIGVDAKFEKLLGFGVLLSNETPGFGDKIGKPEHPFVTQFAATPAEELTLSKIGDYKKIDAEIIAISGATITSDAVVTIFNTYIEQVKTILKEKELL